MSPSAMAAWIPRGYRAMTEASCFSCRPSFQTVTESGRSGVLLIR